MPVYKNEERGTYYTSFYYTDWKGEKKRKKKEGFKTKREAKQFEREFLEHVSPNPDMTFQSLYDLYISDCQKRLKPITTENKKMLSTLYILPYFGNMRLIEFNPALIREWQNNLLAAGKLKITTINKIFRLFSSTLNYAVKFYGLDKNPCQMVGCIRDATHAEMKIWTPEQFNLFLSYIPEDRYELKMLYKLLFWTGMRIGETLALTKNDIDLENHIISVSKTFIVVNGVDMVYSPKTKSSIRKIDMPDFLLTDLKQYLSKLFSLPNNSRIFHWRTYSIINRWLDKFSKEAGLERIRVHDFRHSHASFLIAHGCPITYVSKRLGHENPSITMSTYAHFYAGTDRQAINIMEQYVSSTF